MFLSLKCLSIEWKIISIDRHLECIKNFEKNAMVPIPLSVYDCLFLGTEHLISKRDLLMQSLIKLNYNHNKLLYKKLDLKKEMKSCTNCCQKNKERKKQ